MSLGALYRRIRPRGSSYRGEVVDSFFTNVFIALSTVITGVLLARLLGPQGRGELLAIQALPVIVGSLGMLGLQDAIVFFGARDSRKIGNYAISGTALLLLLGLPIVGVAAVLTPLFLRSQSEQIVFASRIYLGLLFFYALTSLSQSAARAAHDISLWNRLRVLPPLLWLLVTIGLFWLQLLDPVRLAMTYLASLFLMTIGAIYSARRYLGHRWRVSTALWRPMLRYGLPVAAGGTPRIFNQRVDQLIIAGMLASQDLGYYGLAVSYSALMLMPGNSLSQVAFSKIAGVGDVSVQKQLIRRSLWSLLAVSVVGVVALAIAAPYVIHWISEDFDPAVPVAIVLTIGAALRGLALVLQFGLMGVGRPTAVMYSEWSGLATLVGLALVLVPRLGVRGAAWSVVGSSGVALLAAFAIYLRWLREAGEAGPGDDDTGHWGSDVPNRPPRSGRGPM